MGLGVLFAAVRFKPPLDNPALNGRVIPWGYIPNISPQSDVDLFTSIFSLELPGHVNLSAHNTSLPWRLWLLRVMTSPSRNRGVQA
jgi:hypothetical protein